MTMLGVVPGKECLGVRPSILDAAEAIREVRTIFKRLSNWRASSADPASRRTTRGRLEWGKYRRIAARGGQCRPRGELTLLTQTFHAALTSARQASGIPNQVISVD